MFSKISIILEVDSSIQQIRVCKDAIRIRG
jgi:hypothetical protein